MKTKGFTLLEILITLAILAFSLTALINLQIKLHMTELESYQRSQAIVLLQDMADRIKEGATPTVSPDPYLAGPNMSDSPAPLGLDNGTASTNCSSLSGAALDLCEWNAKLKGAAEVGPGPDGILGTADDENIGGMIGARGCIERIQNQVTATCTPAMYRISIAWQGLHETVTPSLTCAQDADYGESALRRVLAVTVTIGLPRCT